jgi:hypothetical protein
MCIGIDVNAIIVGKFIALGVTGLILCSIALIIHIGALLKRIG